MTNRLVEWCYTNESIANEADTGEDTHQYICYSSIIGNLFYAFRFHAPVNDFEKHGKQCLPLSVLYLSKPLNKTLKNNKLF